LNKSALRRAAQPAARADLSREVGRELDPGESGGGALAPLLVTLAERGDAQAHAGQRIGEDLRVRQRRRAMRHGPRCLAAAILEQIRPP
jgi:hypothetical protein